MKQWSIADKPAATLIAVGDEDNPVPTLIQNVDPLNTLYLGNDPGISPLNPLTCAPLAAGQSTVSDGTQNIFGIAAPGQIVQVNTYRGISSFFLPASLSNLGGTTTFVQPTAPTAANIPVNSLWFNTSNNSMLYWNGSVWTQQQFSGSQLIVAATVLSAQIANAAVTTAKIANQAVGAAQVASGSLTSAQLSAAAGILGTQLVNQAVGTAQLANQAVGSGQIANNAVGTGQIANGAVNTGQLANQAVGTAQIANNAVGTGQIAANAVGSGQIANGAVGATQVASGSLTSAQLAAAAGILGSQIAAATIQSSNIAANTIIAANIAANTITAAQLAAGIVYAGIVDGTIVKAQTFEGGNYFGYSGTTPSLDTLVISLVPGTASVTDPVGNTALPGSTTYGGASGAWTAVSLQNGAALIYYVMASTDMNGSWVASGQMAPLLCKTKTTTQTMPAATTTVTWDGGNNSIPVTVGVRYRLKAVIRAAQGTTAITNTYQFNTAGGGVSFSSLALFAMIDNATISGGASQFYVIPMNSNYSPSFAANAQYCLVVDGIFSPSSSFNLQLICAAGGSTGFNLQAGSYLFVEPVIPG